MFTLRITVVGDPSRSTITEHDTYADAQQQVAFRAGNAWIVHHHSETSTGTLVTPDLGQAAYFYTIRDSK